ncbi:MAG: class I SAM-dependent methyltransferase [Planctomycetales bacterium]|nr:class I SAM-dependent methyltransferase [Planctomycetales bacterium]
MTQCSNAPPSANAHEAGSTWPCAVTRMNGISSSQRSSAIISPRFDRRFADPSASLASDQVAQIAAFRAMLEQGTFHLTESKCPCGETAASTTVATIDRYGLPLDTVVCETCGTLRFDPYLDEPSVEHFYTQHYQGLYRRSPDLPAYFSRQAAYGEKVLRSLMSSGGQGRRVLEIGCGAGGALSVFAEAGWDCAGCEYDARLVTYAQSRGLGGVRQEPIAQTLERLGPQSCDLVFSHHVFEHVWNPEEQLRNAARLLKPNGVLLHIVPDILGIDRSEFPAGDALQYFHVAHIFNYSHRGLDLLAQRVGRHARRVTPPSLETPWSHAAEMWIEFAPAEVDDSTVCVHQNGEFVRRYLERTERRFHYGLCLPQLRRRLRQCRQAFWNLPTRVIRALSFFAR